MAQGRAKQSGASRRKGKQWDPPPREAERLEQARVMAGPVREAAQEFAAAVARKLFGEQGPAWGTQFADIEAVASVVGKIVATAMTATAVRSQAETGVPEAHQSCPVCRTCGNLADPEPRSVQTFDGHVEWSEPKRTCSICGKSFFPSEPCFGDGPDAGQSGTATSAQ